jgi:hypothetical protein
MKAQAALEFLTTYGWAFIVILTAIGALAYFGVLKVEPPDRCTIGPEFNCYDFRLDKVGTAPNLVPALTLVIGNTKEFNMNITNMSCTFPDNTEKDGKKSFIYPLLGYGDPAQYPRQKDSQQIETETANPTKWPGESFGPGEKRYIDCYGFASKGGLIVGEKAKVRFTIAYVNQDVQGFQHSVDGEVVAKVQ